MPKFSRSSFMKRRHALAKKQFNFYSEQFGQEGDFTYSDFLKSENPLTSQLVKYKVSYQVSYRGKTDDFIMNPRTFTVVGFRNEESEIQRRTMDMILDSKGVNTGHHLFPNTISKAVEPNTSIEITPRGIERSEDKFTQNEIGRVLNSRFIVEDLDEVVDFKNSKNRKGELKLDIRHFT